jgi:hypothetical protein
LGEALSTIIKWFSDHLSPRYLIVTTVVTGLLLFVPVRFLGYFGLIPIAEKYRGIITLLFSSSFLLLVGYPIESCYRRWSSRRKIRKYLQSLPRGEYRVLKRAWQNEGNAINVIATEGAAKSLERKGILWQSADRVSQGYSITDEAYNTLTEPEFSQMFILDEVDLFGPSQ